MSYKIIDFHTHPFMTDGQNICAHGEYCDMSVERTLDMMEKLGVEHFCGSVISFEGRENMSWAHLAELNDTALRLREIYGGAYIPGFHIHPDYMDESRREIKRMSEHGVGLVGELVPYLHGWTDYAREDFSELLDMLEEYGMVLSIHSSGEMDDIIAAARRHPGLPIVGAHPGEKDHFMKHLEAMEASPNYHMDISGTGMHRYGVLRHGIDEMGVERFLYGSDFPICSPAEVIGSVILDDIITEEEKHAVMYGNAARLLGV